MERSRRGIRGLQAPCRVTCTLGVVSEDSDLFRDLLRPFVVTDEDLERMIAAARDRI